MLTRRGQAGGNFCRTEIPGNGKDGRAGREMWGGDHFDTGVRVGKNLAGGRKGAGTNGFLEFSPVVCAAGDLIPNDQD